MADVMSRGGAGPDAVVRYDDTHRDAVADVWFPTRYDGAPLVVVVHGGFWRQEYDRRHTRPQCAGLLAAGWGVAAIEYRRVGQRGGGWPGTFDDVAAAVDRVPGLASAAAPGRIDADRVVLVGHSAGGHLALWAAARHRLPPSAAWHRPTADRPLRGVVALAGAVDLVLTARLGLGDGAAAALLGGGPSDVPQRYALADPALLLPLGVPVRLVHGDADDRVPLSVSSAYVEAAHAAGDDDVHLEALRGADHFDVIDPLSTAWPAVLRAVRGLVP